MILTGKHLSRRHFLRGVGTVIALPVLDSMIPAGFGQVAKAATAAAKAPTRLSFVYVPNGIVMNNWTPAAEGADFVLPSILQLLAPYRSQATVISGLINHQANALGDGGGDHARAGASFLTGSHPKKTGGSDIHAGISADQVAAQQIGGATRLPSLEIGLDDNRVVGHCDSGYSCAYTNSISWRGPATPLPPESNPRLLFERLFGDFDPSVSAETRARRANDRKSILDSAREEAGRLARDVGAADRRKLDEYLTTVREIEQRIELAEKSPAPADPGIDKPSGIPSDFGEHARLLYDLQALAFQADLTRIATMVIGREGSVRTYEEIGVPDPHHPLSHHRGRAEALEKLTKINTYHMQLFAHFLERLRTMKEGDGTLLDRSMVLYGCGISDSDRHIHENLPVVVAGGGNGTFAGNRHVRVKENTPVTNLYLSLLDRMGVRADVLGDSTGKLEI
ncbi:MAG TPA: DUF1552 domain-containing protein [Opitutaceae bacterium]|nr:DUF1552 domain-containing protein [Opitutaceae bacterium]